MLYVECWDLKKGLFRLKCLVIMDVQKNKDMLIILGNVVANV